MASFIEKQKYRLVQSEKEYEIRYSEKLRKALEKKGISYSGNFRFPGSMPCNIP